MNDDASTASSRSTRSPAGAYIREHFFGPDPRLRRLVEHLSDDDLTQAAPGRPRLPQGLRRLQGGHRVQRGAHGHPGQDDQGLDAGPGVEGRNITHQAKKLTEDELRVFRDRLELPIPDEQLEDAPYYHPGPDSEEVQYLLERRRALGGPLPRRIVRAQPLPAPAPETDAEFAAGQRRRPSARRWSSPSSCATSSATPASAGGSCRSSPTRRARSAWTRCSRRSGSTPRTGQRYEPVDSDLVLSLPRGDGRPGPRGGDHRGGLDGLASRPPARRTRRTASR